MNDAMDEEERMQWVRHLYLYTDKTTQDIALETGVSRGTVEHWVRAGKWDGMKRSLLTSRTSQLEYIYNMLANLRNKKPEEANPKDADIILKYSAVIANLETEISLSQIIEVAEHFINWLRYRDIKLARVLTHHFDRFIKERLAD